MKEKVTYLRPDCDILQTEAVSSFLQTSDGFDPWKKDDDSFDFDVDDALDD